MSSRRQLSRSHRTAINSSTRRSELPRQSTEEPAPRPVLRRKDADAGAAPNLIDLVGRVDDIEAHGERAGAGQLKCMTQAEIDLRIARCVIAVRNIAAVG